MSDLRKDLLIHEHLIKNAQYDDDNFRNGTIPWNSYTTYGVLLIKGIGVCQGYASAANLLLNKAGVKSTMVIGTADGLRGWGDHAWNMVEIDGEHYHLDVTWDKSNSKYIDYSYFNLTDDEISKEHKWCRETVPVCSKKLTTHDILVTNTLGIEGENVYLHDNDTLYKIGFDGYWIYYAVSESSNKLIYYKVNTSVFTLKKVTGTLHRLAVKRTSYVALIFICKQQKF